jgi:hypothetical protein
MHGWASAAILALGPIKAPVLVRLLSGTEMALWGGAPGAEVPSSVVLVGLVAFSVGLLTLYLKTPGMRQEGSIRPIQQGTGLAKDVGLLGTGLTLLLDDLAERRRSG